MKANANTIEIHGEASAMNAKHGGVRSTDFNSDNLVHYLFIKIVSRPIGLSRVSIVRHVYMARKDVFTWFKETRLHG